MPGLTDHQRSVLGTVFEAAPDATVRRLEQALAADANQGGSLAEVHALITKEAAERQVRVTVLGPVVPLCRPSEVGGMRFPPATIAKLWDALRASCPDSVAAAEAACLDYQDGALPPTDVYNHLCARAAEGLSDTAPGFKAAAAVLDAAGPDARGAFIAYLDLAPLARSAIARLPEWLGRMSDERAAAARLAYKDAEVLADDAGPRLIEMLLAHLPEPWLILRVLAAVVMRANDRYLASSELAKFGEYILVDIERRLSAFRAFDPDGGREAGAAAAFHLHVAAQAVAEFENALELSRDGPWGMRVAKSKQTLAQLAEGRLAQISKALDLALPLQMVRFGKGVRGFPKLVADPDPRLIRRAEGLMGFFDHSRASAASSGYGSTRAKVGDAVDARLDHYVEDLLETMRSGEAVDLDRIQAYLEAAAGLIGDARGEKAAQIVRRRAAAA